MWAIWQGCGPRQCAIDHSLIPQCGPEFVARWDMHSSGEHRAEGVATFDVGTMSDARIRFDGGIVAIEPLKPEYWDDVVPGVSIPVVAGTRIVGQAAVVERRWPEIITGDVADFVRAVRRYCAFIATGPSRSSPRRLVPVRRIRLLLDRLRRLRPRKRDAHRRRAPR